MSIESALESLTDEVKDLIATSQRLREENRLLQEKLNESILIPKPSKLNFNLGWKKK